MPEDERRALGYHSLRMHLVSVCINDILSFWLCDAHSTLYCGGKTTTVVIFRASEWWCSSRLLGQGLLRRLSRLYDAIRSEFGGKKLCLGYHAWYEIWFYVSPKSLDLHQKCWTQITILYIFFNRNRYKRCPYLNCLVCWSLWGMKHRWRDAERRP